MEETESEIIDLAVGGFGKRAILTLKYPVEHGIITNWDDIEKVWHHTFYNELRVAPEEHPILITEKVMTPKANREKLVQIMFDVFEVPSLYVAVDTTLALYSSGRVSGIVYDIGDGVTHCVPIYEGHAIRNSVTHLDLAGRDITDYLMKLLCDRGYSFTTSSERSMVKQIKEKFCYISQDFSHEMATADVVRLKRKVRLPDDSIVSLDTERFRCPEVLFQPLLCGHESEGLQGLISANIESELSEELLGNIIASGGSSCLPGLTSRLQKELRRKHHNMNISVFPIEDPRYAAWIGGQLLASLSTFPQMCISKEEYDEHGPTIVHKKCF